MKTLDSNAYREIKTWIHRNARDIELSIWKSVFENGGSEPVLSALAFYQNEDGGFGNALEPDNWNPDSSPYTTTFAINILNRIGFGDMRHPILQGIVRFLESGTHFSGNLWRFSIPSNDGHAHAPWWTYDEQANETESIGVTAEIAGFIIGHFGPGEEIHQRAVSAADAIIGKLKTQSRFGDMGVGGYCDLLHAIQKAGLDERFDTEFLLAAVKRLVNETIERDAAKWAHYGVRPSNYIDSPDSVFYKGNEEIVQKELDYLIDTRPGGGVWGITWSWFENNEKYGNEFAISENWWKSYKAIEKLAFLKNFGRLA